MLRSEHTRKAQTVRIDEEHNVKLRHNPADTNIYTLGCIGEHNVVIACLPAGRPGTHNAATVAANMRSRFKSLRFSLLVGTGGDVPSDKADVRLGDVVISQPVNQHGGVVNYDFGKDILDGFIRTGSLKEPPTILLNALSLLKSSRRRGRSNFATYLSKITSRLPDFARDKAGPDILLKPGYNHVGGDTCEKCSSDEQEKRPPRKDQELVQVHYGTIASGNRVMRDGEKSDITSGNLGGVLCFEMEAAGLMNDFPFPCLVIQDICDYADSHKNKKWQLYAAAIAAACAKEVLSLIPVTAGANSVTTDTTNRVYMHGRPLLLIGLKFKSGILTCYIRKYFNLY